EGRHQERQPLKQDGERPGSAADAHSAARGEEVGGAPGEEDRAEIGDAVEVRAREVEPPGDGARTLEDEGDARRGEEEPCLPAPEPQRGAEQERRGAHRRTRPSAIRPTFSRRPPSPGATAGTPAQ